MIENTDAIVLQTRKYSESSKIAVIYTKDFGKLSVLAKGAMKQKSKFGSTLDPMSFININFYKKANRTLHLLSSAELNEPLRKIHNSIDHIASGLMCLEFLSRTQTENDPAEDVFSLILEILRDLNKTKENPQNLFMFFVLHILKYMGFFIDFDAEPESELIHFSLTNGSITDNGGRTIKTGKKVWLFLKKIYYSKPENVNTIDCSKRDFWRSYDLLMTYTGFHLENNFNLKSRSLLML